jgi:hypothetical protein
LLFWDPNTGARFLTDASTWYEAALTTGTSTVLKNFTRLSNTELRYDGTNTKQFLVQASFGVLADAAITMRFGIRQNGFHHSGTVSRKVSNNDVGAASVGTIVELTTNDYVSIGVWSDAPGRLITLQNGSFTVVEI